MRFVRKKLIGDGAFAVILPDEVIKGETRALGQMVEAHRDLGGHMVATMDVPRSDISKYGVLDVASEQTRVPKARGLVEKPRADLASSTKAVIGRYSLDRSIFDQLDTLRPCAGGELQLTDAINADVPTIGVNGFTFDGQRFDCGSVQGYLQATTAFASDRVDLNAENSNVHCETHQPLRLVA